MKKLLTLIAVCGITTIAFGQGFISLNDNVSTYISAQSGASTITLPKFTSTTTEYLFQVLEWTGAGTPTVSSIYSLNNANWDWMPISAVGQLAQGTNGSSIPLTAKVAAPSSTEVNDGSPWAGPGAAYYVVIGWSFNEGSYTAVQTSINSSTPTSAGTWGNTTIAGVFGYSAVEEITSSSQANTATSVWSETPGFVLDNIPIPEPSTFALVGLAGLVLLKFRRH